jgi:hypothetical protein
VLNQPTSLDQLEKALQIFSRKFNTGVKMLLKKLKIPLY